MKLPVAAILARYTELWKSMQVRADMHTAVQYAASRIIANKERYQRVARNLGLPWFFIGLLHYRESSLNFHCHLHNGDPLNARTVHVPPGCPTTGNPPFTWEESALDALRNRRIQKITSPETLAFAAEDYNGWGYYLKGQTSGYLWDGTTVHPSGEFVADHVYDPAAPSKRPGVMPLLSALMKLDTSVQFSTPQLRRAPPPKAQPWWFRLIGWLLTVIFKQ